MDQKKTIAALVVAALGNFIDVYDIIIFSVVRVPSLRALGLSGDRITTTGIHLLNLQLVGMLVGGICWGVLGDKRGRLSVLFGSIFLYSAANLANAFVSSIPMYGVLRFIAGFGLAGELGAGVTLISEMMSREKRGLGGMIIAVAGALGGLTGGALGELFPWQTVYVIGGVLGFALLILRVSISESSLFLKMAANDTPRGSLQMLMKSPSSLRRYIQCVLVGSPQWLLVGLFLTLAPEIGKAMELAEAPSSGRLVLYFGSGVVVGDFASSLLSQLLRSRKKAIVPFLGLAGCSIACLMTMRRIPLSWFYLIYGMMGVSGGCWSIIIMVASEQFGTNLRATVTTSIPNVIRSLTIPLSLIMQGLRGHMPLLHSLGGMAATLVVVAIAATLLSKETFGRDLNFIERDNPSLTV